VNRHLKPSFALHHTIADGENRVTPLVPITLRRTELNRMGGTEWGHTTLAFSMTHFEFKVD
jgi:hypothetical protein